MWIDRENFAKVQYVAVSSGDISDIGRIVWKLLLLGEEETGARRTSCPQCNEPLSAALISQAAVWVAICPNKHGAWISREDGEKLRAFIRKKMRARS